VCVVVVGGACNVTILRMLCVSVYKSRYLGVSGVFYLVVYVEFASALVVFLLLVCCFYLVSIQFLFICTAYYLFV